MKTDVWMPIYIGDYLADTMHLSTQEHGAYFLLLLAYWRNGGPLRNDPKILATITRLKPAQWAKVSKNVLKFFQVSDQFLNHKRAQFEIKKANDKSAQMADNARKSWSKRIHSADANGYAEPMPNALPSQSQSHINTHTSDASIPTWEEVKAEAAMRCVPEESAKSFFDHHENNALWVNQFNRLIEWRRKLKSWSENDRSRAANAPTARPDGKSAPVSVYSLQKALEAKRAMADDIFNRHATQGPLSTDWSSESKRLEYVQIKKDIKELNARIAKAV